jgi:transposase
MSPDLNPIEHVWDMFDRRVRKRPAAPLTLQELADALIEEFSAGCTKKCCSKRVRL